MLERQDKIYQGVYTYILVEEGEKQTLLQYVKSYLPSIEDFYKHLIPEFKEEVYDLFMQYIEQTASRASNRKEYKKVCTIMRKLKKAGGKEQALEIERMILSKYHNKPAFKNELSKI